MQVKEKKRTLKQLTALKHKVCVYVPSTVDVNIHIDNRVYVEHVRKVLHKLFGGATAIPAIGSYESEHGEVVENVTLVFSFAEELTEEVEARILNLCDWLKDEMRQECIALEVDGQMYFA